MAEHRARPGARRLMAPATLLVAVVLGLTWGGGVTGAYWTESATVSPGTVEAGTLDVVLNGDSDDDVSLTGLAVADLLPGESRAATIAVANVSQQAPVRLSVQGRASGTLAPALRVQLFDGGTATNTGNGSTGYSGACSGTSVAGPSALTASDSTLVSVAASDARPAIAAGGTRSLCVRVSLPATAPESFSQSATIVLTVTGRSVVR